MTFRVATRPATFVCPSADTSLEPLYRLAARAGGVMLRGRTGAEAGMALRRAGFAGSILLDPAEYERSPKEPDGQGALFHTDRWADLQAELRCAALLPTASYIHFPEDKPDRAAWKQIEAAIAAGADNPDAQMPPSWGLLVLDHQWLKSSTVKLLARRLLKTPRPMALALGASFNPLRGREQVKGLVYLLEQGVDICLLRTDVSGVGALAYGATAAAYGLSSGTRHVFPPSGGFGRRTARRVALVPTLLDHWKVENIEQAEKAGDVFDCHCATCKGESLRRFAEPGRDLEILLHEADAWAMLVDQAVTGPRAPRLTWHEMVRDAVELHKQARAKTKQPIDTPSHLVSWNGVA